MCICIRSWAVYWNQPYIPISSIFSLNFYELLAMERFYQVLILLFYMNILILLLIENLSFSVQNDSMLSEKINCIVSVLTGMSSFSQDICSRFVPHLGKILRTIDHSDVSFTTIKCLGYLCKKLVSTH